MKTYNCKMCGKESVWTHQKMNVYCSNKCSSGYKEMLHKEKWLAGEKKEFDRSRLRVWLTEDRGYKCSCCGISDWNGKSITLQVDHIDGNAGNNLPDNLQLICPNCHSQSKTFAGRNRGFGRASRGLRLN